MLTVGLLLFDEVEVLDFAGPFEVFSTAARVRSADYQESFRVLTLGKGQPTVRARGGLVVEVHHRLEDHPMVDVLVVPGGDVTGELRDARVVRWIARTASTARVTASVCTGAFLLAAAGLLDGRRATTHWEDLEDLRRSFPKVRVLPGTRWIDEGDVITSAGISAGLDMSLHLVRRLAGARLAVATARQMDYEWRDGDGACAPGGD